MYSMASYTSCPMLCCYVQHPFIDTLISFDNLNNPRYYTEQVNLGDWAYYHHKYTQRKKSLPSYLLWTLTQVIIYVNVLLGLLQGGYYT